MNIQEIDMINVNEEVVLNKCNFCFVLELETLSSSSNSQWFSSFFLLRKKEDGERERRRGQKTSSTLLLSDDHQVLFFFFVFFFFLCFSRSYLCVFAAPAYFPLGFSLSPLFFFFFLLFLQCKDEEK